MAGPKNKKKMGIWGTIGTLVLLAAVYGFEHWQKGQKSKDKRTDSSQTSNRNGDTRRGDRRTDRRDSTQRTSDQRTPDYKFKPAQAAGKGRAKPDNAGVEALWRKKADEVWVEGASIIVKVLPDDLQGSRHQRFLIRINKNLRVKVAHNIDLAPRLPVREGDLVEYRGKFAWNKLGGAVHWTHHDPRRPGRGGWLRHKDKVYK